MVVEQAWVPALDGWLYQATGDIKINGDEGHLVEEDGFSLLEDGFAFIRVLLECSLLHEGIVVGVAPARVVVAIVSFTEAEEGVRVVVVTVPGSAQDIEVLGLAGGEVGFPFLIVQFNFDAEFLFPDLLNGHRDGAVGFAGIVEQFKLREALAIGEAGLGEQLAGEVGVVGQLAFAEVPAGIGRGEVVGWLLSGFENVFSDGFTVDRVGQCFAHADVAERSVCGIEHVVVHAERGIDAQLVGLVLTVPVDPMNRHRAGDVEVSGAEGAFLGFRFDREKVDPIQCDPFRLTVVWVAHGGDAIVQPPVLNGVRAIADEILWLGPR